MCGEGPRFRRAGSGHVRVRARCIYIIMFSLSTKPGY